MGEELSLSLEETNAIRRKLGLKPIPTGSTDSGEQSKETGTSQVPVEGTPSGEKQQQEQTTDTYHFLDRHKLSLLRKKLQNVRKGISSEPLSGHSDEDDKDWLNDIKDKPSHWKVKLTYNDLDEADDFRNEDDLRTMRVENFDAIKPGEEVVLTLRDGSERAQKGNFSKGEEEEEEEDILENEQLKHGMETAKALSLRRMNQERKRGRLHLASMAKPLAEEGEEKDKESNGNYSDIVIGATSSISQPTLHASMPAPTEGKLSVNFEEMSSEDESGYSDFKRIKTKRRKVGTHTSSRKKLTAQHPYEMKQVILDDDDDDDENNQEDEDWMYGRFSRAKSTNKVRMSPTALDIAESVKKEQQEVRKRQEELGRLRERREGIVMDETRTFFDSLKSELLESTNTPVSGKQTGKEVATTGVQDASSQITLNDSLNVEGASREPPETLNFNGGLASTLQFLRERHLLPANDDSQLRDERLSREQHIELQKLRDSIQGNPGTGKAGETEWHRSAKRLAEIQRERSRDYNPTVNLVYKNDKGTELTTKEAWKVLSKKFHEFKERKKRQGRHRVGGGHKQTGPHD